MSSVEDGSASASETDARQASDLELEVVVIPVSDMDRAKDFYVGLGWRLDPDVVTGEDFRVVQITPPGSQCSVIFGHNVANPDWPDWYAEYMVREQAGDELPS
ncbi:MAG TPA: VOC family protein [Solirubrobacteraceae bacterium]|jgi:catechol 2,3-dioxygenase-like lactoylglutathione lyase family enzyme|nr:VOC family protein [Solirubrobacteraceae bacterium]